MRTNLLAVGASFLMTGTVHADLVYSETFTPAPVPATGIGPVSYNGSSDEYWVSAINFLNFNGDLTLNENEDRGRGAAVWLDAAGWANGTVTVEFDVSGYDNSQPTNPAYFQAYYANNLGGSATAAFDLHQGLGDDLATSFTGAAELGTIGSQHVVNANGTDLQYTFDYAGEEHIALVFYSQGELVSFDNITVNTIPEPATFGLLGLGLGLLLLVRRRLAS